MRAPAALFSFEMNSMENRRHLDSQQATPRQAGGRGRRRHPFLRRLEYIFWFAGAAAGVWFVLSTLGIISYQVTQARRLDKLESDVASGLGASVPGSGPMGPLQPGDPFGRISIPRIGLSAMVAEGDDEDTLRHAVGHIPGTAAPWGAGNVALAGHRDTFFRGLSRVRLDDVIQLETLRGTFKYRVERITVVGPQDVEVLQSPEWDLTLVTCFPFHYVGPAPQRYIVQGTRVGNPKR
jgi:LPXTG-site transpeptidase (sortase) family protein